MGEYELWVNMNYGWIWFMCKYESWVNLNHGWIWYMCKCELWVNMNYGWGDRQSNTQTDRHISTITRPGLGAGPSENSRGLTTLWPASWSRLAITQISMTNCVFTEFQFQQKTQLCETSTAPFPSPVSLVQIVPGIIWKICLPCKYLTDPV